MLHFGTYGQTMLHFTVLGGGTVRELQRLTIETRPNDASFRGQTMLQVTERSEWGSRNPLGLKDATSPAGRG